MEWNPETLESLGIPLMPSPKFHKLALRFAMHPGTYKALFARFSLTVNLEPESELCSIAAIEAAAPPPQPSLLDPEQVLPVVRLDREGEWINGLEHRDIFTDEWHPLPYVEFWGLSDWHRHLNGDPDANVGDVAEWGALAFSHQMSIMFKLSVAMTIEQINNLDSRGRPRQMA